MEITRDEEFDDETLPGLENRDRIAVDYDRTEQGADVATDVEGDDDSSVPSAYG